MKTGFKCSKWEGQSELRVCSRKCWVAVQAAEHEVIALVGECIQTLNQQNKGILRERMPKDAHKGCFTLEELGG